MDSSRQLRSAEEHKQSISRMRVSMATFVTLAAFNFFRESEINSTLIQGLIVVLTHTLFSIAWYRFVRARPLAWPSRIYVSMAVDLTCAGFAFFFAARFGSFFYPVFLWIIIGYGLRYGKRALLAAVLTAFVNFGLVLKFHPYWHANPVTGTGMWWGILILPTFFLTVLDRLGALNSKLQVELVKSQAAEQAKGDFLANMSHEIRTPLNGILGMAQILDDVEIGAEGRKHLDIQNRSAESLLDIVNDILDFSKISSGKMTIEAVPFDLQQVLQDVTQVLQPATAAKGLTIEQSYPPNAPTSFVGDPVRVRQIVLNLAGNAVKFTDEGRVSLEVVVDQHDDAPADVAVKIIDTGIGIPTDRLPHIFKQFEQVDASTTRNFGGTGLGLAISSHLAQKMGGGVTVTSQINEGSIFTVSLKLLVSTTQVPAAKIAKALPQFDLAVLVAEDNSVNRLVIGKLLQKVGITANFAENGVETLAEIERQPYDLIFMDVRMPVMDGLEATRRIRARGDQLAGIPIIALTADADSDSARRCLDAGMDIHLGKPVVLTHAVAAIERLQIPASVRTN